MPTSDQLWTQFVAALSRGNAPEAFNRASTLRTAIEAGEPRPAALAKLTLAEWRALNPGTTPQPGALILQSIDPALSDLADYMLAYRNEGDGVSLLIPK